MTTPTISQDPLLRDDIRACLTAEQASWLERRIERRAADAAIAYRVSTALFGNRFFIALLAGRELRSTKRIQQEGLRRSFGSVALEIAIMCLAAAVMVASVVGFGVGLFWLVDQALGVTNLPDYLDKLFH
jgi:hypothetical protein